MKIEELQGFLEAHELKLIQRNQAKAEAPLIAQGFDTKSVGAKVIHTHNFCLERN